MKGMRPIRRSVSLTLLALVGTGVLVDPASAAPRIVFSRDSGGDAELVSVRASGGDAQLLTSNKNDDLSPAVSPDGRWVAFTRYFGFTGGRALYVMRSDGSGIRQVTEPDQLHADLDPTWSPDGKKLAFTRVTRQNPDATSSSDPRQIFRVNIDGSNLMALTPDAQQRGEPAWAPDGEWIFYQDGLFSGFDILRMKPDGTKKKRLTDSTRRKWFSQPAWHPDGDRLVFVKRIIDGEFSSRTRLCVMHEDGGKRGCVARAGQQPSWSSDGSKVIFKRGGGRIVKKKIGGDSSVVVRQMGAVNNPVWLDRRGEVHRRLGRVQPRRQGPRLVGRRHERSGGLRCSCPRANLMRQ